ncbi:acyl-CoA N-acyltransferase [Hygrophoropsis aurantiaca]|uniref:Acyl-CoA N-acyltransferase n=1 Tax=Hygrophoropsis aurantiaca TaxID=72124 RepID=A0ACB8A8Z8_9AGAM|nr:acyl-CoA N-acyltransferase [Hygrophoropsis aurantiaca]
MSAHESLAANLAAADSLVLILPDGTTIATKTSIKPEGITSDDITDLVNRASTIVSLNEVPLCTYHILQRTASLVISSVGTSFEHIAAHVPSYSILEFVPPSSPFQSEPFFISIADFWGLIYIFFTKYDTQENIPILIPRSLENHAQLRSYVLRSGLGRTALSPSASKEELFLSRAAFWQGAGTLGYHTRGWLPAGAESTLNAHASFPAVQSFTRTPLVITSHPLRPPKPKRGEVVYRRYCPTVKQVLELIYFDIGNEGSISPHLQAFHNWQNNGRVDKWWNEAGTMEKHKEYIQSMLDDPAVLPLMMSWDGELMGYTEIVWVKENHVAAYVPNGAKDWDRGVHVIMGEEKFRGSVRAKAWFSSLHHYCFLVEPRTTRLIGEPRTDHAAVLKLLNNTNVHIQATVDFPYKRSFLACLPRERYFKL